MHNSSFFSSLVVVSKNEEKVVLLDEFSLRRVAINMLRRVSVFTSSGSWVKQAELNLRVITDSIRNQYRSLE